MKLDTEYTHIKICPVTKDQLFRNDLYRTDGVCPKCGHIGFAITHYKKIVGRYSRPSFYERWFQGKETEFLNKEEEDKIMDMLSGNSSEKG